MPEELKNMPICMYPILIYTDRYGNGFIAVAEGDLEGRQLLQLAEDYADEKAGPFGDDNSNWAWHSNIPDWAFVASTPNEAYNGLILKFNRLEQNRIENGRFQVCTL